MKSTPVILILAAGCGTRFRQAGGVTDKLDAPLKTNAGMSTVLQHVLTAAKSSGVPWHLVTRQDTAHFAMQGMGTSIAAGVSATLGAKGWLILPGDLPLIRPESIVAVANALRDHEIVVPIVQGQQGHPVGFGMSCRDALLGLSGDQGARQVFMRKNAHLLKLNDIGCIMDVDTPEHLAHAETIANESV